MPSPNKRNPKCCGCSSTGKCYYFCGACGHRYLPSMGTVEDDNGTWIPEYMAGLSSFRSIGNFSYFAFGPGFTCKERRVEYFIRFQCGLSPGKISARIEAQATSWYFDCRWPDSVFAWYPGTGFYRDIFSEWSHVAPSNCDPLSATFMFTKSALWPGYLPLPASQAILTMPVDETGTGPGDPLCCGPCAIPRSDLTMSWHNSNTGTGTGTMIYDSVYRRWVMPTGGPWGVGINDGTASLRCGWGIREALNFVVSDNGGGFFGQSAACEYGNITNSIGLVDFTCDPYHMHFRLDDEAIYPSLSPHVWLRDLGYTDFWIDE